VSIWGGVCGLTLTAYRLGSLGGRKGEKSDHFTPDVVASSQEQKCELKYDIHTLGRHKKNGAEAPLDFLK
jgi:hypothetical protein